ncbi:MAG: DUF4465 domain-containing protein [Saprospiraceae bacterium]
MRIILTLFICLQIQCTIFAQEICTFNSPALPVDTFYTDFSPENGFECGSAFFQNEYFTDFGGLWKAGWAVSSGTDLMDSSEDNLFTSVTGSGSSASDLIDPVGVNQQYGIGQQDAYILLDPDEVLARSIEVTNTFHVADALEFGTEFSKPFGGDDGGDPDFFLLTISAYFNGVETGEFVDFFLADYRFLDNELDYIIDTWQLVDLSPITFADSLTFTLTSSDIGEFGINQPPYFAVDNLVVDFNVSPTNEVKNSLAMQLFPNPATDILNAKLPFKNGQIQIYDSFGKLVQQTQFDYSIQQLNVADLPQGIYIITTTDGKQTVSERFVKL